MKCTICSSDMLRWTLFLFALAHLLIKRIVNEIDWVWFLFVSLFLRNGIGLEPNESIQVDKKKEIIAWLCCIYPLGARENNRAICITCMNGCAIHSVVSTHLYHINAIYGFSFNLNRFHWHWIENKMSKIGSIWQKINRGNYRRMTYC